MQVRLLDLTDASAYAECRRILLAVNGARAGISHWFNDEARAMAWDENCAFCSGMLGLFRYARGESVPRAIVRNFLDMFLSLMFCGLASGAMALPPFAKMADKPWAVAWRVAEIRLSMEEMQPMPVANLAHLFGMGANEIENDIASCGMASKNGMAPAPYLRVLYERLRACVPEHSPEGGVGAN